MLAATLGRHVGNGALENLQKRLLDALAADFTGDGRVFVLLGDLVDFVDIDNALLRLLNVAVGSLQQLQDNVLDVLANVSSFSQSCGVDDRERHIEHARKSLRQQGLACARGTDEKNIGLAEFDFAGLFVQEDALVVIVNGDRQFLFRAVLPDHVAVQELLDLRRTRQAARWGRGLFPLFVFQDRLADPDTLVADVRPGVIRRRTDELLHLLLRLVAEGAAKRFVWRIFFHVCEGLSSGSASGDVEYHSRPIFPPGERESVSVAIKQKRLWISSASGPAGRGRISTGAYR